MVQGTTRCAGITRWLSRPSRWTRGRIGNAGRKRLVGPSLFSFDAVMPERANATVRIEAFIVFNHANFFVRSLNLNINTATAGAFSQITDSPRQMQFGFRVDF
jgi:hypothetical protein